MLNTEEMTKVLIVGPDNYLKKSIESLYNLGVLHIKEHKASEELDIGSPLKEASEISEEIVNIRSAANYLKIDLKKGANSDEKINFKDVERNAKEISNSIKEIQERLEAVEDSIKQKEQMLNDAIPLAKINIPFEAYGEYKSLAYFAGRLAKPKGFSDNLRRITTKLHLFHHEEDGEYYFALFADREFSGQIMNLLQKHSFSSVDLLKYKSQKGSPKSFADALSSDLKKLKAEKEGLLKETADIKSEWEDFILLAEKLLAEEIAKAESPLKFAKTKNSFFITGWIPKKNFDKVNEKLKAITKNNIYLKVMHMDEHENVPIKMKNPRIAEPFEFFMNLYSLPSYHEIDPTFFVFLSFPIFFGFMLGDIGYGLVTLALFYFMKKKMPKIAGFFNILILASVTSIIFGVIFGEFFGYEQVFGIELWRAISRNPEHSLQPLMVAAIFWGVLHVNLGLVIGFINELREHGMKKAIFAKGSWFVLEIGAVALGLSTAKLWGIPFLAGIGIIILSAIGLLIGEGMRGLFEIPSIFGNILSYLRLMAIGLSSVGLAVVINNLAEQFFKPFGILSIFGILILALGHALNIALGLLGGFLHSMRLHYVEFFTKFYKGGGIPYNPFGKANIDSKTTEV